MSAKKVLIVDDDAGMQDAFRTIFERAGYETIVFNSAKAILDGTAPLPDIYVLDKQLSGVDGLDVCSFLKKEAGTKHLPVIMVSASPHIVRLAKASCADGAIEKPFRRKALLDLVAQCIKEA